MDNLNLDIKKNEFLTLLGPSGCGKTTTLKIIAGFEHADEGEVMFEGENVNDTPPYERQVNTVFQKYVWKYSFWVKNKEDGQSDYRYKSKRNA